MPPKKQAADTVEVPVSTDDVPMEEKVEEGPDAASLAKLTSHPSTAIMVREALKELDSRKGVSSQAIQSYIKQKYPSVDQVRLKHLVRRALKKGIETGTLVRPANSNVTTGATGKFRLAPKTKEAKTKSENTDPNVQKVTKAAKEGAKKSPKAGTTKKDKANEEAKTKKDPKPPKKPKKGEETQASKPAPAKKPKAKKDAEKGEGSKGTSDSDKPKAAKKTKGAAKSTNAEKPTKAAKTAKAGDDAPAPKAPGKRGKKTAD
ncbi:protein B4 [Xyrichtys novacula]|uniref:Protein B4 n=1 Tax=Xyrichtys novacula TaxID=13765 RepID=A0AAV1ETJ5_XYRNO|nr:protein B4 [Xyrichtys novacula]